jgi:hypothetical protein
VVEDQRHERHRRGAVPVEDTLTFVGEDVKATGFVILEGREQRAHHASAKSWASSTTIESNRWPGSSCAARSAI